MPNSLYWEDAQPGETHELPVLQYHHKHAGIDVPWNPSKWDAIEATYPNPLQPELVPLELCCDICGHEVPPVVMGDVHLRVGRCAYCARTEARAERDAAQRDRTMGSTRVVRAKS
jgi:hypothetical protein